MSTGKVLTAVDDPIGAGNLVHQPQIDTNLCLPYGCCRIGHLTLEVDVPASSRILRKASRLDDALDGPRQPQTKAVSAVGDRVLVETSYRQL